MWEDRRAWQPARERRVRRLQSAQLRGGVELQPGVHRQWTLAHTDIRDDGAIRERERPVRLLKPVAFEESIRAGALNRGSPTRVSAHFTSVSHPGGLGRGCY